MLQYKNGMWVYKEYLILLDDEVIIQLWNAIGKGFTRVIVTFMKNGY